MDVLAYIMSKKYVDQVVSGMGSLQGKSAYEIAVEQGFSGTEAEWLKSLEGETPHIGENGNWFLGDVDTGINASPDLEGYYNENNLIPLTKNEILEICKPQ